GSFWVGMIKAPLFAFLVATTATFWGMKPAESPEEVGRQVTSSVVQSIFLVIVADAAVSVIVSYMRI
ncbi:MAG TPA: ABC transporter permease, partial [Gammaproteobacteria bacterium]|nr:ABC transporter permease [Gammaproteobacteria bacterium]